MSVQFYIDIALLFLRIGLGIIFIVHGINKWQHWKKRNNSKMDAVFKALAIIEPLAGLSLLAGFLIQLGAAAMAIIMLAAIYFKIFEWKNKFTGDGGWELDFLILVNSLAVMILGGGRISLNYLLFYAR
ncbi:DoxX family protein [Candidatus Parcubacteria bacterium]|nr:MAG: DoxX family protein [Candidatus Parcubacteria bacterium]